MIKVNIFSFLLSISFTFNSFLYSIVYAQDTSLPYPFDSGDQFMCVGTAAGNLKCFGLNYYGQLGLGNTLPMGDEANEMGSSLPFINLGTDAGVPLTVKQVNCGTSHACVILNDNKGLKCWGSNSDGQLGLGDNNVRGDQANEMGDNLPFVNLGSGIIPVEVSAGFHHTCIKFDNKKVKCFGNNGTGQLGYGDTTNRGTSSTHMGDSLLFVDLGTNAEVSIIKAPNFGSHNCVILSAPASDAQRMKCWGRNDLFQLGYGTLFGTTNNHRGDAAGEMGDSLPVIDLGEESRVRTIGLPTISTCAITITNLLKCWGNNESGILGIGSITVVGTMGTSLATTPVDSETSKYAVMVEGGDGHLCFLLDDYTSVKCLGNGGSGRLGQGDAINRGGTVPTMANQFPAINLGTGSLKIKYLAPGYEFTCIGFVDNTVKCFGNGGGGRIGSGNSDSLGDSPTEMGSDLPFVDLFSTLTPTKNPTIPTTGFFGPNQHPIPGGSVKSFDLYLLIDTSRQYELINVHCVKYKLMSGASPSSCFDLMMDYSIETVKAIASSIGYYVDSAKDKGLRVAAYLISCLGTQRTPTSTLLFGLTGDSSIIMNALNQARTNTVLTEPATCPLQGFYDIVQGLENTWAISDQRPYKAVITFTDGLAHDASANTGNALINVVTGIRNRCTQSLVVVPFRYATGSTQGNQQTLSLQILTGNNIVGNVFEGKVHPRNVIPKIGEQITTLLISNVVGKSKCYSSTSYSTSDRYWCGYNRPALCLARASCEFMTGGVGCRKKESMNGCVGYLNQSACDADVDCEWKSTKCTRKPEETDCNALVLQSSCLLRSTICDWNSSTSKCVAKSG